MAWPFLPWDLVFGFVLSPGILEALLAPFVACAGVRVPEYRPDALGGW